MNWRNRTVLLVLLLLYSISDISGSTWRIPATEVKYQIAENSPPGQILGIVSGSSVQKSVTNSLGAPSQFFHLDPDSSELTLKSEMDAEKMCALATRRDDEKSRCL